MAVSSDRLTLREQFDLRRFFRGEKAVDGPIVLSHRRIFILPNRHGLGLGLLLVVQTLVATNYSNNLSFILSFLLASIALIGILRGFSNLAGLVVRPARVEPVFAGEDAIFEFHLENRSAAPRLALMLTTRTTTPITVDVPAGNNHWVRLPIPARHRGRMPMPMLTLASTFPLGLFRAWSLLNLPLRAVVYPTPAPGGTPFPEHSGEGQGRLTDVDDFRGFQPYQPGDPLRRIHWKGVAKGQGVLVKEYWGQQQMERMFDWDRTPGADTEARLSQLCRWVLDAERAGITFGLRLPGISIEPDLGPQHGRRCLEALALYGLS